MSTSQSMDIPVETKFSTVDYSVFITMLTASAAIGVYNAIKSRGHETTQVYMLGSRAMSPIPVAFSIIGGVVSAISILGNPTEVYLYGTQVTVSLLGIALGTSIVYLVHVPVFYNLGIVSICQYIKLRYNSHLLHKLVTFIQIFNRTFVMSVYLYSPALALSTVTTLTIWTSIVVMGVICTFYIAVGGVKAVVYADVMQTLIMFTGVLVVVVFSCIEMGGVGNVWSIAEQGGRIEFLNLDPSPFIRNTFWSSLAFGVFFVMSVVGNNQIVYQRLVSVQSVEIAKGLCFAFVVGVWILFGTFYFSGLVSYVVYSKCDPLTSGKVQTADQILPYLVMHKLGHLSGLPGLFVAALYGGVLSSLSSSANSIACLIWEDFLKDVPYFRKMSEARATNVLKILSTVAGLSGVGLAILIGNLGNIFQVAYSLTSIAMGPCTGLYAVGLFSPWVGSKSAFIGTVVSFTYNLVVMVGKFVRERGAPPHLPLSTEGCLETIIPANITFPASAAYIDTTTEALLVSTESSAKVGGGSTVYDVTYCLSGFIGVLMTFLVSNIVCLFIGPQSPNDVDERTCCATSVRLHRWLWGPQQSQDLNKSETPTKDNLSLKVTLDDKEKA